MGEREERALTHTEKEERKEKRTRRVSPDFEEFRDELEDDLTSSSFDLLVEDFVSRRKDDDDELRVGLVLMFEKNGQVSSGRSSPPSPSLFSPYPQLPNYASRPSPGREVSNRYLQSRKLLQQPSSSRPGPGRDLSRPTERTREAVESRER